MKERLRFEISRVEALRALDQVDECRSRYWDMPKEHRIDHGLRPDVTDPSGFPVAYDELLLSLAAHGSARTARPTGRAGEVVFDDPEPLFKMVSDKLLDIEKKLEVAEFALIPHDPD